MAGDETVKVPFDAVITHAGSVDGISQDVETARGAANQVHLGTDAYGQLCQILPTLLEPISQAAVNAMASSVTALAETADNLRAAAAKSQATDQANAQRITTVDSRINLPL